jgi:hypothetical protein
VLFTATRNLTSRSGTWLCFFSLPVITSAVHEQTSYGDESTTITVECGPFGTQFCIQILSVTFSCVCMRIACVLKHILKINEQTKSDEFLIRAWRTKNNLISYSFLVPFIPWRALVNALMNLRVPWKDGKLFSNWATWGSLRSAQLREFNSLIVFFFLHFLCVCFVCFPVLVFTLWLGLEPLCLKVNKHRIGFIRQFNVLYLEAAEKIDFILFFQIYRLCIWPRRKSKVGENAG